MIQNAWLGMLFVVSIAGGLMGGLWWCQKRFAPHPEWLRKSMHVGSGVLALTFPWLFDRAWPVIVICVGTALLMLLIKMNRALDSSIGSVVGGVRRESQGELYFPLTVALIFLLSQGDPILYCIPIFILTFADAAAALIGVHYGLFRYKTPEGVKSTEGSLAFFLVAFFGAHLPLLLFTDTGRTETVLIAVLLGFLLMIIEAVGWRGLDNLLIPLLGFFLLKSAMQTGLVELSLQVFVTGSLLAFVFLLRPRLILGSDALLGAVFVGYLSWTLGGWRWLLAPLVLFVASAFLYPRREEDRWQPQHIHVVLWVCGGGMAWLFFARAFNRDELIYPFFIAFAAQLAMISIRNVKIRFPELKAGTVLWAGIVQGWVLLFLPFFLVEGPEYLTIGRVVWSLLGVSSAAITFYFEQMAAARHLEIGRPWLRQALYGTAASSVGIVPLYFA